MNLFKQWQALFPDPALQAGVVIATLNGVATIELPDGNRVQARGVANDGDNVFVRNGLIEGEAPDLPEESAEV